MAAHLEVINRREVHLLHPSKHTCMIFSVGVGKEKKPYFFFLLRPASHLRGKSMCCFFFLLKEVICASKKKIIQRFYPRERDMHHAHACKTLESLVLEVD